MNAQLEIHERRRRDIKNWKSDSACHFVGVAEEWPDCAGECCAALNAAVRNLLKVVRFDAASQPRGRDARDDHPVSAMRAGKEETREA
jgi:hypothetical protein